MNTNPAVVTETKHSPYARLKPVSIKNVHLDRGFWQSRIQTNQSVTLNTQYELLESTDRLGNFLRAAGNLAIPHQGHVFNDSDVYKWLEAASWTMAYYQSDDLLRKVEHVISLISAAQDKDGYLNTYFSLDKVGERWTNLQDNHELYCAGHLIQAAIAHHRTTGEEKLLNVAIHLADHLFTTFGPSRLEAIGGHPEVEMALIELYRTTGEANYLELASQFINRRGYGLLGGKKYFIDHLPFRNLHHLAGHAVRALYLCCGVTDLVLETGENQLLETLNTLWSNMVQQQMYITGGIGARHDGESFGKPYELPNASAYAETCAAIASVMWSWRMLQMDGDPRYADLLEWTLYNAVLPGISMDGKQYFYVNPLQADGSHRRQIWYECACCPTNISRTIAMLPGYLYSKSKEGIWLHMYASSHADIELTNGPSVGLHQLTSYPWDGQVTIDITIDHPTKSGLYRPENGFEFSIFFRLPGWLGARYIPVKVNDQAYEHQSKTGAYLEIHRTWHNSDHVAIDFPMEVRLLESHPFVVENTGRIALARGPLVYCLEEADNSEVSLSRFFIDSSEQTDIEYLPALLDGVVQLKHQARIGTLVPEWDQKLYRPLQVHTQKDASSGIQANFIPYFTWANRIPGAMQVWHTYR